MLWEIFWLSTVNSFLGLVIFGCGIVVAVRQLYRWRSRSVQSHNPGGSGRLLSGVIIVLFVVVLLLTSLGWSLLVHRELGGQLVYLEQLAPIISLVQGFVYGTAGIVIGLLGLLK